MKLATREVSLLHICIYLTYFTGEDGVTIDGAIKLVKFAFCFEQWEVFEALNDSVLHYLRVRIT